MAQDYVKDFSAYPNGQQFDRAKLIAQVQADELLTQALHGVAIDTAAQTVTYTYAAALDSGEQAALDACVAAYEYEALADAKARFIADCMAHAATSCAAALVEHPGASGKYWPTTPAFRSELADLVVSDVGAIVLRTHDGLDSHSFADTAAVTALLADVCGSMCTENGSRDSAIAAIVAAVDIATAEAARDAYLAS